VRGITILLIEDDLEVAETLKLYLYRAGYNIQVVGNGLAAMDAIKNQLPGLVIVDIKSLGMESHEISRWIRDRSDAPIIMLTTKLADAGRVAGFEMGADDYIVKPFNPQDLVYRVREVLRRVVNATEPIPDPPLVFGNLRIDPTTRLVHLGDQEIILTAKEFDMLWLLASHPRQIFTRDQLLERIWGHSEYIDPGTVTVHIRRLREKIEEDPAKPIFIHTVWGSGYKFEPESIR
jgi:DNA-binding response OmpR family regulator